MKVGIEHNEITNSILQNDVKNNAIHRFHCLNLTILYSLTVLPPRAAPELLKSYGLGMVFRRVLEGSIFWKIKPASHLPARAEIECQIQIKRNVFLYLYGVRYILKQITNVTEPQ